MSSVYANGRSITHKGDGHTQICTLPDVCKTPSPGGPVPVPYVNAAKDADLVDGSTSTEIEGNPIALSSSSLSTSTGDEPGTAGGGIISGKIKGKLAWASSSIDVKVEGKGVVRFLDVTLHNGNRFNIGLVNNGDPFMPSGWTYGDDDECPDCKRKMDASHQIQEHQAVEHGKDWTNRLMAALIAAGAGQKPDGRGYMLGVLFCKDGTRYAATSGRSPPSFMEVALEQGFKVPTEQLRNGTVVTMKTRPNATEHEFEQKPFGNKPLECAAPKLLQLAISGGKDPCCMTEQWVHWDSERGAPSSRRAYPG